MSLTMDLEEFFKLSIQNYLLEKLAELEVKFNYQDDENYNFNLLVNMIKDFITFSIQLLCLNKIKNCQKILFAIINDTFVTDLKQCIIQGEKQKWGNKLHEVTNLKFQLFTRILNIILFFELGEDTISHDILSSYKQDILQLLDILLIKMGNETNETQTFYDYFQIIVVELFKTSNNKKAYDFFMEILKVGQFDNDAFSNFENLEFKIEDQTPKIEQSAHESLNFEVTPKQFENQIQSLEKELLDCDKENNYNSPAKIILSPKTQQIKRFNSDKILCETKQNTGRVSIKKSGKKNKININVKLLSKSKQINQLKKYYTLHKSKLHVSCQSKRSNLGSQQYCKIVKAKQPGTQYQSSYYYPYAKQYDYSANEVYYLSENSTFPDISTEKAWQMATQQTQQSKLDYSQSFSQYSDQIPYIARRLSFENNIINGVIALNTDDEDDIIN